jgi:hypothetical protein
MQFEIMKVFKGEWICIHQYDHILTLCTACIFCSASSHYSIYIFRKFVWRMVFVFSSKLQRYANYNYIRMDLNNTGNVRIT